MYRRPPSPTHRPSQGKDEDHLPKGECRYLLLHPELRGQRCACVNFSMNQSTPGSSCECGHGACYHIAANQEPSSDREEIEALKQKIDRLEEMLDQERRGTRNSLAIRLSELEEVFYRCKTDTESEIKSAYRGLEGIWHHVGILQRRARDYDDKIDALLDSNLSTQDDVRVLKERVMAIDDSSMLLEERLDAMDPLKKPDDVPFAGNLGLKAEEVTPLESQTQKDTDLSNAWTVHISLLPKASQPFPFERETAAHSRCLSRGLHRIVTIPGSDSKSFTDKISEEFVGLLKGRSWMPLVAKLCDAKSLCGLPMLKKLPSGHINEALYDHDFVKQNCAVQDADGKIVDLYIAMCDSTLSWPELRESPTFVRGLEACWEHVPLLDNHQMDDDNTASKDTTDDSQSIDDLPSAGDILSRGWSPPATRLKRTASAVSRTSSFSSSTDGDGKRARIQRSCVGGAVVGRRAEAV